MQVPRSRGQLFTGAPILDVAGQYFTLRPFVKFMPGAACEIRLSSCGSLSDRNRGGPCKRHWFREEFTAENSACSMCLQLPTDLSYNKLKLADLCRKDPCGRQAFYFPR